MYTQQGHKALSSKTSKGFPLEHRHAIEALLLKTLMSETRQILGIAANQVEEIVEYVEANNLEMPRVFLALNSEEGVLICWDPLFLRLDGDRISHLEGCLSIEDTRCVVERYNEVIMQHEDSEGRIVKRAFKGLDAAIVQHEKDHLDGTLISQIGRAHNE